MGKASWTTVGSTDLQGSQELASEEKQEEPELCCMCLCIYPSDHHFLIPSFRVPLQLCQTYGETAKEHF